MAEALDDAESYRLAFEAQGALAEWREIMPEMFAGRLERAAREALAAWEGWCAGPGWDNAEYDAFAAALVRLRQALEHKDDGV